MKKVYFLMLISILVSCSSDSDTVAEEVQTATTPVLITSSRVMQNGNVNGEATYNYMGSKLLTIERGIGTVLDTYTYDGDLIIKIETQVNGNLVSETDFEYDTNEKLIHYYKISYETVYGQDEIVSIDYTHNTNATISYVKNESLLLNGVVNSFGTITGTIHINNGMITTIQNSSAQGHQEIYTYDSKNSPFKNITGFDKLIFENSNILYYPAFSNILSKQYTTSSSSQQTNYSYEYNANDYPIKQVRQPIGNYVPGIITEYTYNQ